MKQIFRSMWRAVKKNMVSLLLFETGYRTASFLLVMHAVSAAVDYSLKAQNFSYLTAENYLKFLASPLSVVLLLGILILILLLFLIEISALLSCFRHSYQGRKIYTSDMLIEGVKRSWDFPCILVLVYYSGRPLFVHIFSYPGNFLYQSPGIYGQTDL